MRVRIRALETLARLERLDHRVAEQRPVVADHLWREALGVELIEQLHTARRPAEVALRGVAQLMINRRTGERVRGALIWMAEDRVVRGAGGGGATADTDAKAEVA